MSLVQNKNIIHFLNKYKRIDFLIEKAQLLKVKMKCSCFTHAQEKVCRKNCGNWRNNN